MTFDHVLGVLQLICILIGFIVGKQKLAEIHVLVNSRLTEALDQITELKKAALFKQE